MARYSPARRRHMVRWPNAVSGHVTGFCRKIRGFLTWPWSIWGTVQMRVTPGPQNQAQRTQSVSPIGLVVNGLPCAASHTHTTSLRCHPHVPTFEPCPIWPCEVASKERRSMVIISGLDYPTSTQARLASFLRMPIPPPADITHEGTREPISRTSGTDDGGASSIAQARRRNSSAWSR